MGSCFGYPTIAHMRKTTMADQERRRPTLADRFVAKRYGHRDEYMHRRVFGMLQGSVRAAHKFVLDANATTRIAHVVRDIPDLIIREFDFARAPFDLTWVEFPHDLFWREVGNPAEQQDDDADMTVGYLIDGNSISVIIGGTVGSPLSGPHPSILRFALNTEWSDDEKTEYSGAVSEVINSGGDTGLDQFYWGSTLAHMDQATRDRLRTRNRVTVWHPSPTARWTTADSFMDLVKMTIQGSIGELRNVVAIMLMLNRPSITRYTNAPPGKGFSKGKLLNYMAHTTVTIDLDAVPTMRLLGTPEGEGVPRRRHEVRGHYCQNREARDYLRIAGCIHSWQPCHTDWEPWPNPPVGTPGQPGMPRNWQCDSCGGKRWWKNEHERGDASLGYTTHDYEVTSR